MARYIRNSAICLGCNKEIESKSRNDFVMCECPNKTFVDGGLDYIRRGGVDLALIKDTSVPRKEKQKYFVGDIVMDMANGARFLITEVDKEDQSYIVKVLWTPSAFANYGPKRYSFYMANNDFEKEA